MNKFYTAFLLLLLGAPSGHAQLTNAQVYDFAVGDVFQVKYEPGIPPAYRTDTVIAKYYSPGMDTLFYTYRRVNYTPSYMSNPATTYVSTITEAIINLNQPAPHFNYNSCLPPTDSMDTLACGADAWIRESTSDSTCFEPPYWISTLIAGKGGPYVYSFDPSIPGSNWWSSTLVYSNTAADGPCGTFYSIAGIEEQEQLAFAIYPNPVHDEVTVSSEAVDWEYELCTMTGARVLNGTGSYQTTLDLSSVPTGMYFLKVLSDGRSGVKQLVKF